MSLTYSINSNLPYMALASVIFILSIILYRIIRILTYSLIITILHVRYSSSNILGKESPLKKFARNGFIAQALGFFTLILSICIDLFFSFCRSVIFVAYLLLPLVIFSILLAVVEQKWTDIVRVVIDVFNQSIGPTLRNIIAFPLTFLEYVGTYVIPAFNLLIYVFLRTPISMLFSSLTSGASVYGSGYHAVQSIQHIGRAFPALFSSIEAFVESNQIEKCKSSFQNSNFNNQTFSIEGLDSMLCVRGTGNASKICTSMQPNYIADACLDPSRRMLDFDPMFYHLRVATGHGIMTVGKACETVGLIANVTFYPLSDPLLWNSTSMLLNGFLHALVVAPMSAYQRCQLAGGLNVRPAMCTPDFGPSFEYVAQACKKLGDVFTNWIDVMYVLVSNIMPSQIKNLCSHSKDFQDVFRDSMMTQVMFKNNVTLLVRMTTHTFAITDGNSAVFVDQEAGLKRAYAPSIWPVPVNPEFGIARALLPSGVNVNDGGVGLFGCRCSDNANTSSIEIECTTITKQGNAWTFPVQWSLGAETRLLRCNRVRIVIQSIRKHHKRIVTSILSQKTQFHRQLTADIAVYVIPVCGSSSTTENGIVSLSCFEEKFYTRGICFPYCMGLRMRHESYQPMTMRGAAEWRDGVIVTERNCILSSQIYAEIKLPSSNAMIQTRCSIDSEFSGQETWIAQEELKQYSEKAQCSYDSTCLSILKNKSETIYDAKKQLVIPIIDTLSNARDGARLILNGQPIAVAGNVFMRMYAANEKDKGLTEYIDFPTIVGDQYNEFAMEYYAAFGIPVTKLSTTPSREREFYNMNPGSIYAPAEYIQNKIPYNPAALSEEAIWYVTNPSYEWAAAFINYCSSEGLMAQTQIMLTSSYAPLTVWKVRYQSNNLCYVSMEGNRMCSEDIATSSPIDINLEFPIIRSSEYQTGGKLYELCSEKKELNLWAESLEDFDEYNIVIAVRRGAVADMGPLLNSQNSMRKQNGKTVFYFVFKYNMTQVRENVPWDRKSLMLFLSRNSRQASRQEEDPSSQIFDMTCPALRMLPNVGSILGHSMAAVVYMLKMPVNLLLNPFAINELLTARFQKTCPENSLMHSALDNCGMSLVSMDPFFYSIYEASHAFWDLVAWVTQSVLFVTETSTGLKNSKEMTIFKAFLDGGQIVGDASKLIVMFDIVRSIDVLDTKYQDAIEKTRRRRLLSSLAGTISGGVKSGVKGVFSLSKSVFSAMMAAPFAGADLSVIIATTDPRIYIVGSSVSAPSIAWVHFTYDAFLPVILDVLSNLKETKFTLQPLWIHLHQAQDKYREIIHKRHLQACSGMRLMFGFNSKFGKGVYYNCLAATSLIDGSIDLALSVFVELPLYKCMCISAAGEDYVQYVYQKCEYLIPANYKSKWQSFLKSAYAAQNMQKMCENYFQSIEKQMYGAFDSWTQNSLIAVENIGSFINELISADTRSCNDIQSNPTAMVLTPLPVHHFQVCSKTKICREKCRDSIEAFEYQYKKIAESAPSSGTGKRETINVAIESPLFNKFNTDGSSLNSEGIFKNSLQKSIRAIKTHPMTDIKTKSQPMHYGIPNACILRCSVNSPGFCLSVLSEDKNKLVIEHLCIPRASTILGTVYHTRLDTFEFDRMETFLKKENFPTTDLSGSHMEFSMHNGSNYVLMYMSKISSSVSLKGEVKRSRYHAVYTLDTRSSDSMLKTIVRTDDLKDRFLTLSMQEALFGNEIINPALSDCEILEIVEINSQIEDRLHFFISFKVQIQAFIESEQRQNGDMFSLASDAVSGDDSSNIRTDQRGHRIHAVLDWCDETASDTCSKSFQFFLPCSAPCTGIIATCQALCKEGVDQLLYMGQQGSFQFVERDTYFYMPSGLAIVSNNGEEESAFESNALVAGMVQIRPFEGIVYSSSVSTRDLKPRYPLSSLASNLNVIGAQSRSQLFDTTYVLSNAIRDSRVYTFQESAKGSPVSFFQVSGGVGDSMNSEWIKQVRLKLESTGWTLKMHSSQTSTASVPVFINCSINSCSGCGNNALRLFCHAAQDCALTKCIGTVIQTRNVLCGIGGFFEHTCTHAIVSWNAVYMSLIEIILIISKSMNQEEAAKRISLKFPTEQFYSLVCTCKEMYGKNIGLGLSVVQMLYANFVQGQIISGGGLDLVGKQDVGVLVGEQTLKSTSIANLIFNSLCGSTLLPVMALHKWLICTANASLMSEEEGSISVQFEDVAMDTSWLPCAKVNGISKILNGIDMEKNIESVIETFISFSLSLLSGLGQTILYALQLTFESTLDFFISFVWSIQDILYTFNMRSCKVPNYAMRYVLWCSCNDTAYRIPGNNRAEKWDAFWCVGTLSVNLMDGTANAIIYNPYSMDELSMGVKYIIAYIECISTSGSENDKCISIMNLGSKQYPLEILSKQGVDPVAVWAKCKTNYLQNTWDAGSGVLFYEEEKIAQVPHLVFSSALSASTRQSYVEWATREIGQTFVECMRDESRFQIDYSSCMREYFSKKTNALPNAYFIYELMPYQNVSSNDTETLPDACLVFSGLNQSSNPGTPFQQAMHHCLLQEGVSQSYECPLNPSIWSNTNPKKISVAKLHGTVSPFWNNVLKDSASAIEKAVMSLYKPANDTLKQAFEDFVDDFLQEEQFKIEAMLFSADGDFIHEFFDCVFMGPYNRIDLLPCDKEGVLTCPFYARDELGGKSRSFTPCYGEAMGGDYSLPFTCGSQIRRSLIKYFFRNYSKITNSEGLSKNISIEIFKKVNQIFEDFISDNAKGCFDSKTQECSIQACSSENAYYPCMNTIFEISEKEVGSFIIERLLSEIEPYMREVFQDSTAMTAYYNLNGTNDEYPFQWQNNLAALELSMFDPNIIPIKYDSSETYQMPLPIESKQKRVQGSIWGTCMALLSQASMTIPIENRTIILENGAPQTLEMPLGAWKKLASLLNLKRESTVISSQDIEEVVKDITEEAIKSHAPFVWHKSRRHAPSKSMFCNSTSGDYNQRIEAGPMGTLLVGSASIYFPNDLQNAHEIRKAENIQMPLYGFSRNSVSESSRQCICAVDHDQSVERCKMLPYTCQNIQAFYSNVSDAGGENKCRQLLLSTCSTTHQTYHRDLVSTFEECLMMEKGGNVKCPEMGPSDVWGFFPVDCSDSECDGAKRWMSAAGQTIIYEGARFLNEGRGGLRLPNYKHVLNTYQEEINYEKRNFKASQYVIGRCFDVQELVPNEAKEMQENLMVDDFIQSLFPAAQIVFDSPGIAVCSRYVIEIARYEALKHMASNSLNNLKVQLERWKRKCEAKVRHMSMCNMMGIYFDMKPPLGSSVCEVQLHSISMDTDRFYITPQCILVDREAQIFYDAVLCAKNNEDNLIESMLQVQDSCALSPQPTVLMRDLGMPYSMLFSRDGSRMLPPESWIEELSPDFTVEKVETDSFKYHSSDRDHVSYVLDWWPESVMPEGHHVTSATDPEELAPVIFDSHYVFDESENSFYYTHTTLRNASLLYNSLGSAGICRTHTIGMPMFHANTNRICSRIAKNANQDTPTYPTETLKNAGDMSQEWPFTLDYIDQYFEKEQCAETERDIPYNVPKDEAQNEDFGSKSAGGIPGWNQFTFMDQQGRTFYKTDSYSFPPEEFRWNQLYNDENAWGPCQIHWQSAPKCDSSRSDQCYQDSICLPLSVPHLHNETDQQGICFSTRAYQESIDQQHQRKPCFATFHCQKGDVCLADGGCSPLYFHMWNPLEAKESMEFTILADSCEFKSTNHPYTQTTRGASPWEQVPDILHSHGFCSHRNWFSYRHSIRDAVCPVISETAAGLDASQSSIMRCKLNATNWPWIHERFDGEKPSISANAARQSMEEGKFLLVKPHPCDQTFMHLQNPLHPLKKRFEVCSGFEGDEKASMNPRAYFTYNLDVKKKSWDNVKFFSIAGSNASSGSSAERWLRTYKESTNEADIGVIHAGEEYDTPLGFLGANKLQEDVRGSMALKLDNVKFFRCESQNACSKPPYTYNGIQVQRLDPETLASNLSEYSLRKCGSIGYMSSSRLSEDACTLDIRSFPLVSFLLWKGEDEYPTCKRLFKSSDFDSTFVKISPGSTSNIYAEASFTSRQQPTFLCEMIPKNTAQGGICLYAARATGLLTNANAEDHVQVLIRKLNTLLFSMLDSNIARLMETESSTKTYESINICTALLMEHILEMQRDMQSMHQSAGPSGLYTAMKFTLYEIPLAWFQHAMHISLLKLINPNLLGAAAIQPENNVRIQLPLWDAGDKLLICRDSEEMLGMPLLLGIICRNKHPEYTFLPSQVDKLRDIVNDITTKTRNDIQEQFIESSENAKIFCHKQASWDCFEKDNIDCVEAQRFAHNTHYCSSYIQYHHAFGEDESAEHKYNASRFSQWLDPCKNVHNFRYNQAEYVPLKQIETLTQNTPLAKSLETFLYNSQNNMIRAAESVAHPIDYIALNAESNAMTSYASEVSIVRVWGMDASQHRYESFNLTKWLTEDVCKTQFQPDNVCVDQDDALTQADTGQCMFNGEFNQDDFMRFVDQSTDMSNVSVIRVFYQGKTEIIRVCDLDPSKETCFTQNTEYVEYGDEGSYVPCGIIGIEIPAGIEVKAYGISIQDEEWYDKITQKLTQTKSITEAPAEACSVNSEKFSSSQIFPCSWDSADETDRWSYYGNVNQGSAQRDTFSHIRYSSRTKTTKLEFDNMNAWWPQSPEWTSNNKGCKKFSTGICSFKVRFENIPGVSKAVCGTDNFIPNCGQIINWRTSTFATSKVIAEDKSNNLFRCAPCTKIRNTISQSGLFNCFIGSAQSSQDYLTQKSVEESTQYLYEKEKFKEVWGGNPLEKTWFNGSTSIEVTLPLIAQKNPVYSHSLLKWGKTAQALEMEASQSEESPENMCSYENPSACWKGFDMKYTAFRDNEIWNQIISNPSQLSTMTCHTKPYSELESRTCNPKMDARRQELGKFAENHYRKRNGMWVQKVDPGYGSMWQVNVAHPGVSMFTVMHSSAKRAPKEVMCKWVLGNKPCDPEITLLQERICVSSSIDSASVGFQPLHPWIGGDFNPFEGDRGLDECSMPYLFSGRSQTRYMCPCQCEPSYACSSESNAFNYSSRFMDLEFYMHSSCSNLKFPETASMNVDDESNLCSFVKKKLPSKECLHRQGLFGGTTVRKSISEDELHSHSGIPTDSSEFLIQTLLDLENNGMWTGKTLLEENKNPNQKYAFLSMNSEKMGRRGKHLNPAHVAFTIDTLKSEWPLVVKAIALLPNKQRMVPGLDNLSWLKSLQSNLKRDKEWAESLYPQMKDSSQNVNHWSCPSRIFTFWGNSGSKSFAPLSPNPLLSKLIYSEFEGAHPFVPIQSLLQKLGKYKTTNGACFYYDQVQDYITNIEVPIEDFQNPCGIKRMIQSLESDSYTISKIMHHFNSRCQQILDHPNIATRMRSHANENIGHQNEEACGALHRLTPFLLVNRGNKGKVRQHQTLTTSSEGGDCHMGRAFLYRDFVIGRHCALFFKNQTHGMSSCQSNSNEDNMEKTPLLLLERKRPRNSYSLLELSKSKNGKRRRYMNELNTGQKTRMPPTFWGPSRVQMEKAEVSFGLLLTPSLSRVLANDLKRHCAQAINNCSLISDPSLWMGKEFLNQYKATNLTKQQSQRTPEKEENPQSMYEKAKASDDMLWNTADWTWSTQRYSQNQNATYIREWFGTVDKQLWLKNRFQACHKSFQQYYERTGAGELSVRNIPLCEPAPTKSLQRFCKQLLQYKNDIALINCQIMGNGECLYNPGMFYLPYMWSVTNQEFSAETVQRYYEEVALKYSVTSNQFKNSMCPARNDLLRKLADLSRQTAAQCPGYQIEFLKDTLESVKSIGYKLIFMMYSFVMFFASLLASLFATTSESIAAATESANVYMMGILESAAEVLLPILDAILSIVLGNSPAGKVFKDALETLCNIFNDYVIKWWSYQWCIIIKPALYGVFEFLKGAAGFFHSGAGEKIGSIWASIAGSDSGGSDFETCMAGFVKLTCKASNDLRKGLNDSEFLAQPMATRCWIDSSMNDGFTLLTGNTQNDYFTCTVSDTCALESINFDSYGSGEKLIACASCPDVDLESMSSRFGCNTYLKRCTCGARRQGQASQCLTSSDCRRQDLKVCSLASSIDAVRASYTSLPCTHCLDVGTEPTCIMDGSLVDYGVCSCVSVYKSESLQKCNAETMIGQRISLMRSTQSMCFISPDPIVQEFNSPSFFLDFDSLAMGPCAIGISDNYCLFVQLPVTSGDGQQFSTAYVVISQVPYSAGINLGLIQGSQQQFRRRLLSAEPWLLANSSYGNLFIENKPDCLNVLESRGENREKAKECIHSMIIAKHLTEVFNISDQEQLKMLVFPPVIPNAAYLQELWKTPEIIPYLLKESNPQSLIAFAAETISLNQDHLKQVLEHLWNRIQVHENATIMPIIHEEGNNSYVLKETSLKSRRLLQENQNAEEKPVVLPVLACYVIEEPLQNIMSAFWDTVTFYKASSSKDIKKSATEVPTKEDTMDWWKYKLHVPKPASNQTDSRSRGNYGHFISSVLSLKLFPESNATTQAVLDSLTSDVTYERASSENLLTGTRIIREASTCNYTLMTMGNEENEASLLQWTLILFAVFFLITTMCCSSTVLSSMMWVIVFPMLLFWIVYSTSPLCWPMIPPKFAKDLASETLSMIPESIKIPYFLIHEDCITVNEDKLEISKQDECFKSCDADPFYMTSWQDPMAWWTCELSPYACTSLGGWARNWNVMQDFASSADYFAEVMKQKKQDEDFFQAHRLCAALVSYEITVALFVSLTAILVIPSCIEAIVKIFSGALVLLLQASSAEYADDV